MKKERKDIKRAISDKDLKKPIKFGRNLPHRSGSRNEIKSLKVSALNQRQPYEDVHKIETKAIDAL